MEIGVRVVVVLKLAIQCPLVHNSLFQEVLATSKTKKLYQLVDQCNSSSILTNPFLLQTRIGWTSTVQIKKGTRPFPGLIETVRDTYVYERCMHESWWSSYWLLLKRLFPPFLSFYCLMPSHQLPFTRGNLPCYYYSPLSCFLSLDKLCMRFLRVPTPMHAHSLFNFQLSLRSLFLFGS